MRRDYFAGCVNEPLPGVIERQVERECDLSEFTLTLADVQIRRKNQNGVRQTLKPLLRPGAPPNLRQGAEELLRRISQ